jgi:hypothetical protein
MIMLVKELVCVDPSDYVNWNVRCLVLEATMDINVGVDRPAGVAEALQGIEFVPLRGLCIVNFKGNDLSYCVGAASDDHHERAQEEG